MKERSFAIVSWFPLCIWLLAGCAGNQMRSEIFYSGNHPQILIPWATLPDIKGLAMGSARAKGWNIVSATDDLLVMQRPVDLASLSALALGAAKSAVPPVIEVTSAFAEQSGGVNVALGATLISQPPGEKSPTRVDYTESYRGALKQSLESLRSNWTTNRQRVANAMPTQSPNSAPPAAGADTGNTDPLVQAWGQTVADGATPRQATRADPGPAPTPARAPGEPREPPFPAATPAPPAPAPGPHQAAAILARPPQPKEISTPRLLVSTPSPAPVVDGSSAPPGPSLTERTTPAQPTPEPVDLKDNMLTLNQAGGAGVWAYYAEQHARLRGCNVTDAGAQLINSSADGEILKVHCVGSDSYLLKCQNGVCRGLGASERGPKAAGPKVGENGARQEQRVTRTQAKATKSKARSETTTARAARPEAKTAKPEAKTPKADAKAAKPEAKTPKADAKAAKPEAKTPKADAKAAKPEAKTVKVDSKEVKLKTKTTKAEKPDDD